MGCQGRVIDGDVFWNSAFHKALEGNKLNLPDPTPLPTSTYPTWLHEQNDPFSYVFVADDALLLGKHCMKPYPQTNLADSKRIYCGFFHYNAYNAYSSLLLIDVWFCHDFTASKMSVFGVNLLRIFPLSDWIQRDAPYFSAFSANVGKCRL